MMKSVINGFGAMLLQEISRACRYLQVDSRGEDAKPFLSCNILFEIMIAFHSVAKAISMHSVRHSISSATYFALRPVHHGRCFIGSHPKWCNSSFRVSLVIG